MREEQERRSVWRSYTQYQALRQERNAKPVELIEELLKISPPEALVLDPFIGSGTTAIACLRTGRHFVGFELSEEYYLIARKRIMGMAS